MLNHFLNLLKKIEKLYNTVDLNIKNVDFCRTEELNIKEKYGKNRFFPKPVMADVNKNLCFCYLINCNNTNLFVYTSYNLKEVNTNKDNILKIVNNICRIISIMRKLFDNDNELTVHYFDCKLKKKFPNKKGIILAEENCNSGSSYVGNYLMFVYRREEYIRVLIHELIHSFLGDFELIDDNLNKEFTNYFCLKYDDNINVNETYTETLATILNLIYHYLESDRRISIEKMFQKEFEYSISTASSILKHYSYHSINQLIKNNNCKGMEQKTSVFNYYILKPFMLNNLYGFFILLKKYTNNFVFLQSEKCKKKFIDLILNNFNDKNMQRKIDSLINRKNTKDNSLAMVFYN